VDPHLRAATRSTRPGGWRASNGQASQPHPENKRRVS
jgi:hypothetical protein